MAFRKIFPIVLALLLIGCNSSDDNDNISEELITYEYFDNAQMAFVSNQGFETLNIESGNKTVFKYFFKAEDDMDISDDEYAESIYFEVDNTLDSFSYSDDEFRDLSLFIKRSCFCANVGFVFPTMGTVTGTKLQNGNWDVSVSITFQWDGETETNSRTISGSFELQPIP